MKITPERVSRRGVGGGAARRRRVKKVREGGHASNLGLGRRMRLQGGPGSSSASAPDVGGAAGDGAGDCAGDSAGDGTSASSTGVARGTTTAAAAAGEPVFFVFLLKSFSTGICSLMMRRNESRAALWASVMLASEASAAVAAEACSSAVFALETARMCFTPRDNSAVTVKLGCAVA